LGQLVAQETFQQLRVIGHVGLGLLQFRARKRDFRERHQGFEDLAPAGTARSRAKLAGDGDHAAQHQHFLAQQITVHVHQAIRDAALE
jgi:hypothetical protein